MQVSAKMTDEKKSRSSVRNKRKPGTFDKDWIRERMDLLGLSVRSFAQLARFKSFSPVQRLIEGKRKLKRSEVEAVAFALQMTPATLLFEARLPEDLILPGTQFDLTRMYGRGDLRPKEPPGAVAGAVAGAEALIEPVTLAGWIDGELLAHEEAIGLVEGCGVPWPGTPGNKKRGLRFQTVGGGYSAYDGALLFYEESGIGAHSANSYLGRICVVQLETGGKVIRIPGRGMGAGTYHLHSINGQLKEKDCIGFAFWPVLAIIFPNA